MIEISSSFLLLFYPSLGNHTLTLCSGVPIIMVMTETDIRWVSLFSYFTHIALCVCSRPRVCVCGEKDRERELQGEFPMYRIHLRWLN